MKQSFNLSQQAGATLIAVLLMLLLITVAGAIAVRQSRTDLQVATSDQINTVLLQTADNANQKLEAVINGNTNTTAYHNLLESPEGFIGYFYKDESDKNDHEVIYCQTGEELDYLIASATVRVGTGTMYNDGYCTNGSDTRYTSSRNVMVGQVGISPVDTSSEENQKPLQSYTVGEDINRGTSKNKQFNIRSNAAIPAFGNTGDANACFSGGVTNVSECLKNQGVPQTEVLQLANIARMTTAKACVDFGSGNALTNTKDDGSVNLSCLQ